MTRSTILTVLFVALAALGFTSTASAHYDPALGRWLERDPAAAPVRIGAPRLADAYRVTAGGGTPVQWQLADGVQTIDEDEEPLPLYEYANSAPVDYLDPFGLFSINYYNYVKMQWTCCKCLVYNEAGGESGACMDAVAWILRNRMKDGFRAHRMETDFCKQANMPKTFEGGYPNPRYKNCLACSGNDAERGAMDRAGRACISMLNGSVDPTGGAQFWWTKGRSPGWIKNNPKCKLVTIPGCNLDIWKCSSEPLASDTQKPPTKPKKPKK